MDKDGGSAFPEVFTIQSYDERSQKHFPDVHSAGGMSLRDYFAAKAMGGLAAVYAKGEVDDYLPQFVAEDCYKLADALLAARERSGERE